MIIINIRWNEQQSRKLNEKKKKQKQNQKPILKSHNSSYRFCKPETLEILLMSFVKSKNEESTNSSKAAR